METEAGCKREVACEEGYAGAPAVEKEQWWVGRAAGGQCVDEMAGGKGDETFCVGDFVTGEREKEIVFGGKKIGGWMGGLWWDKRGWEIG